MVNTDENNEGSFGGTRSFGTFNQKPSNGPQNDRPSAAFGGFRGGQGGRGGFASRGGSSGPGTGANRAPLGGARDDGRDFGANDGNNDNKQTADGGSSLRGGFGGRGGRGTGTSGSTGSFGGGRGGSSFSSGAGAGSFGGGRGGGTSFGAGAGTGSFGGGRGGDSTSATGGGSSFAGRGGGGGSSFASRGGGGGSSFSGRGGGNSFGGAGRGGSSFGTGGGTSSFGGDASRTFGRRDDAQDFGAGRNTFGSRFGSGGQGEVSQRREFTSEEERNRERSYIPPERSIEDIVADDTKVKDKYVSIREEDDDVEITGVDSDKYQQMLDNWNDAGFEPKLIENIERSGYTRPRKIQSRTIPLIMDGHDVKGHAETGSGKSAAFLLPIIDQIMKKKKAGTFKSKRISPYAVIIEPSRELAIQLFEQAKKLANGCDVSVERAYGKYFYKENLKAISTNGCDILIGTLGRLFHFFSEELILCGEMKILVLDEADQLLEDESARDLRRIAKTNDWPSIENRQTLLFSATFPEEVHKWAEEWIKPTALLVSNKKLVMANARVLQNFVRVNRSNKNQELLKLFQQELAELKADNPDNDDPKIRSTMVFVKMKRTADVVSTYLNLNKMESTTINGDRPQALRHQALNDFRSGKFQIVVTTDVCARGIDLKDLDHVINMDLPLDYTTYVHRIGRTGRLKEGAATSFFDPTEDVDLAKLLVEGVQRCDQEVPEWLQMYADGKTPPDDEYQEETNNQTPDPPCPGPSNAEEKENNDVPEATQETVGSENEMAKTEAEVTPSKKAALPAADNNDW